MDAQSKRAMIEALNTLRDIERNRISEHLQAISDCEASISLLFDLQAAISGADYLSPTCFIEIHPSESEGVYRVFKAIAMDLSKRPELLFAALQPIKQLRIHFGTVASDQLMNSESTIFAMYSDARLELYQRGAYQGPVTKG